MDKAVKYKLTEDFNGKEKGDVFELPEGKTKVAWKHKGALITIDVEESPVFEKIKTELGVTSNSILFIEKENEPIYEGDTVFITYKFNTSYFVKKYENIDDSQILFVKIDKYKPVGCFKNEADAHKLISVYEKVSKFSDVKMNTIFVTEKIKGYIVNLNPFLIIRNISSFDSQQLSIRNTTQIGVYNDKIYLLFKYYRHNGNSENSIMVELDQFLGSNYEFKFSNNIYKISKTKRDLNFKIVLNDKIRIFSDELDEILTNIEELIETQNKFKIKKILELPKDLSKSKKKITLKGIQVEIGELKKLQTYIADIAINENKN